MKLVKTIKPDISFKSFNDWMTYIRLSNRMN